MQQSKEIENNSAMIIGHLFIWSTGFACGLFATWVF